MKDCDIMEAVVSSIEETIFKAWKHEGFIGGLTSGHANFEIDNREYVLVLHEVKERHHWSEYTKEDA